VDAFRFAKESQGKGFSVEHHTAKVLEKSEKLNKRFHHLKLISSDYAVKRSKELDRQGKRSGRLFGLPVSVKDCLCIKGIESTAGSKILSGYLPVSTATAVKKLEEEGAVVIAKTAQDEFGFGTFSTNILEQKIPLNPFDLERSCGGSSGGSAGFTAVADFPHVSVGESTGGSIACPASFCGVVGLTPSYGRVSRHGLIDYANSLDKIGAIAKTVREAALLLELMSGKDEKDSTSLPAEAEKLSELNGTDAKKLRVGVVKEFFGAGISSGVSKVAWNAIKQLESEGARVEEVSLPLNAKFGIAAYYLIALSEASTNLARYCGMRYGVHEKLEGNFDEYFSMVRSKNFSKESKRRIILGTFARMAGFRGAYYVRAMKARTKLVEEFRKAFKSFTVLAHPTMPLVAPKFSEIEKLSPLQQYSMDLCTVPANLAGLPHISVNAGKSSGMPVGLMFSADHLHEKNVVSAAAALEAVVA